MASGMSQRNAGMETAAAAIWAAMKHSSGMLWASILPSIPLILGISHAYIDGFSPQYGFLGITVALIGRLRPLGILFAAALYASLITGATAMQSVSDVPFSLVFVLQGILILLITSQRIGGKGGAS